MTTEYIVYDETLQHSQIVLRTPRKREATRTLRRLHDYDVRCYKFDDGVVQTKVLSDGSEYPLEPGETPGFKYKLLV